MATTNYTVPGDHEQATGKEMAEAQWHIENATLDVTQFMQAVPEGAALADAEVFTPEGEAMPLSSLWAERPALLVTGSMTCPPSRRLNPVTSKLAEEFGDRLNVAVLYIIDAHPSGDLCPYTGTDWVTTTNQEEGVLIRQPRDQEERNSRAGEYRTTLELSVPVLVDNMRNEAWAALGKSPHTAVLVNTSGQGLEYQTWFHPDELKARLVQLV